MYLAYVVFCVVVFVTLEDILMYIIIVCCCNPNGDVLPSFWDVIIVYGPWGTTSIVSWGTSPQDEYNKVYCWVSLGEVDPVRVRRHPSHVLGQVTWGI